MFETFGWTTTGYGSQLVTSLCLSALGYIGTLYMIPKFTGFLLRRGIFGKDLCKRGTKEGEKQIPEAVGVIPATIFLICIILLQLLFSGDKSKIVDFHSALLSICFMILLGFVDDVLDLPWRFKLLLPTVATLPLLCAYNGSTSVLIPHFISNYLVGNDHLLNLMEKTFDFTKSSNNGGALLIDLSWVYLVYMGLLAVFCTNAVNIYAGINGLECGQCIVIATVILCYNLYEISMENSVENNLFSAEIMLPFIGVSFGTLFYNWFPSKVFVGDTYCYFAGMTFAVAGIHGHFSKTLVLMFLPQWLNFFLSLPQLFKIVPCPRHRVPM